VMAGYAPTPAEEMGVERTKNPDYKPNTTKKAAPREQAAAPPHGGMDKGGATEHVQGGPFISEKQRKLVFAVMKGSNIDPQKLKARIKAVCGVEDSAQIPADKLQDILHWMAPDRFEAPQSTEPEESADHDDPHPDEPGLYDKFPEDGGNR
jgi:hypothetical protein